MNSFEIFWLKYRNWILLFVILLLIFIIFKNIFLIIILSILVSVAKVVYDSLLPPETFDANSRVFVPLGYTKYDLRGFRLNTMPIHDCRYNCYNNCYNSNL